jgi:hypothetical protein
MEYIIALITLIVGAASGFLFGKKNTQGKLEEINKQADLTISEARKKRSTTHLRSRI